MLRTCDADSGRSSCSAASITFSPVMDHHQFEHQAQVNTEKQPKIHGKHSTLKVSTHPRSYISLLKSPDEKAPFPSCRLPRHHRNPVFNIFDNTRMGGLSNAHSSLNIACSTKLEQDLQSPTNAVSLSAINEGSKDPAKNFRRGKPVQRAASRLYKAESLKGVDSCIGPEFIVRASQPSKHIQLTQTATEKRVLTVVLLNGQRIDVSCDPCNITAGQLFAALVESEKYDHNFMLGIAVLIGGDFVFLPDDYKIKKVAPESWSKSNNKKNKIVDEISSVTVFLRIKFFLPKNIANNIQGGEWRHRVYLQLRRATVEGQMTSTIQNIILLAGYALHIEFGEFSYREHGTADYFLLEHYLPEFLITNDMADIKLRMKRAHESRRGLDKDKAIINYITLAQTFRDYGSHFYSAVWATRDGFCRKIWLSIGPRGITLFSRENHMSELLSNNKNRIVLQSLPWHHIHTFYYNKKSLYIMPNAYSGQSKMNNKYKLKMTDNKSYFIFWLASLHHRLYLKLYAKEDFIDYLSGEVIYQANGRNEGECSNYQDSYNLAVRNPARPKRPIRRKFKIDIFGEKKPQNKENHNPDTEELLKRLLLPQPSLDASSSCSNLHGNSSNEALSSSETSLPRRQGVKMGTRVFNGMKQSLDNRYSRSPRRSFVNRSEGDLATGQSDSDDLSSEQKQHCNINSMKLLPERQYSHNMGSAPTAYVLESPKVYSDAFNYNETVNESSMNTSIFDRLDNMECVQGERVFVTAVLQRDKMNALGLQVAEGSDGNVYIKSITPGSSADSCQKLLPGDQIISVNGQTLLNLKYESALSLLQSAPQKVELIVLQNINRNLMQSDKRASIASAVDTELTDDELLNEEALKTIYALIKLTKEKVISKMKDKSSKQNTPTKSNLQKCRSENKVYEQPDNFTQVLPQSIQNSWHTNLGKSKRRPLSLSIPSDVHLPDDYLNEDVLLFKSSLKSIQSSLNSLDKSIKSSSSKNVALPRNFGLSRRWLGPVRYPVTPCKNNVVESAIIHDNVIRRHFIYATGDSDEDQIFL